PARLERTGRDRGAQSGRADSWPAAPYIAHSGRRNPSRRPHTQRARSGRGCVPMSHDDRARPPKPSTYEEAEAILQKFAGKIADSIWASLSEEEGKALLKNLAPPPDEDEN